MKRRKFYLILAMLSTLKLSAFWGFTCPVISCDPSLSYAYDKIQDNIHTRLYRIKKNLDLIKLEKRKQNDEYLANRILYLNALLERTKKEAMILQNINVDTLKLK